jgi:ABC-type lipoprotein export system ATPase subunit
MTKSDEPIVRLDNVSRQLVLGGQKIDIVRGVTLAVERGESLVIVGSSGSGKSSLLELMGTLSRPSSGTVFWGAQRLSQMSARKLLELRRKRLGFVFQSANLIDHLSAVANVALPLAYAGYPKSKRVRLSHEWLEKVGLSSVADRPASRLSGGERQRVSIARALAGAPDLVLADEPTGSLDQATGQIIMDLMVSLVGNQRNLVVVTHDASLQHRFNRSVHMAHGQITVNAHAPVTSCA